MEPIYKPYILLRDNNSCVVCGQTEALHIHHIKTQGSGGSHTYRNLITLCHQCHTEKAHGKDSAYYRDMFREYTCQYQEPEWWFLNVLLPSIKQKKSYAAAARRKKRSADSKRVLAFKEANNWLSPWQVAYRKQKEYKKQLLNGSNKD